MSVYKPKRSPYFHYDFQLKGRRFFGSIGTADRETAKAIEAAERTKVAKGEYFDASEDMTLDVAFGRYYTEVAELKNSADTTFYQLENLKKFFGGDTFLSEITGSKVAQFVAFRRGQKSRNSSELIAPGSVNREVELLRRVMYRARDVWEAKIAHIVWKKHKLKEPPPRDRVLSGDEEGRLLAAAGEHLRPAIRFSLLTGLRLDNAVTLDWSKIDMRERCMAFRTKGDKTHRLPITEELLVLLANLGPKDSGPVFTYRGRAIKTWKTAFKNALRRAGIEDFRWHDLRHTAASRMAKYYDIPVVQEFLNHADIKTTRRYVHHRPGVMLDAVETLSESRNTPEVRKESNRK